MLSEDIYLTSNILLNNNKLYSIDEKNRKTKITLHNWQKYLDEYGWEDFDEQWQEKLMLGKKLNRYGIIDCGGEGDCLFHCLSFAMNNGSNFQDIRNQLSEKITSEKFQELISIYQVIDDSGEFEESWDPHTITYEDFKELIILGGNNYWGDSLMLNLLQQLLDVNVFVLYSNELDNTYYNYPLLNSYDKKKQTILLLYENEMHFQLIGYFSKGIMIYKFQDSEIPLEIRRLVKLR